MEPSEKSKLAVDDKTRRVSVLSAVSEGGSEYVKKIKYGGPLTGRTICIHSLKVGFVTFIFHSCVGIVCRLLK